MNFPRLSGATGRGRYAKDEDINRRSNARRSSSTASSIVPSLSPLSNHGYDIDEALSLPITMKGLVWKRREGMGKHLATLGKVAPVVTSTGVVNKTEAWEYRLMELRGTKLLYYYSDAEKLQHHKNKQKNWLINQAKTSIMGIDSTSSDYTSRPRGILDLKYEKAAIHASYGHSGAPSPFCISIQINLLANQTETKYKLAFDSYLEQMQWLVAMNNVAIEASVDTYNVQLLQAVSKAVKTEQKSSSSSDELVLSEHQSSVREPPRKQQHNNGAQGDSNCNNISTGGHRLWMMDKKIDLQNYITTTTNSKTQESSDDVDDDDDDAKKQKELEQANAEIVDLNQKLKIICTVLDQANNQIATLRKEKAAMVAEAKAAEEASNCNGNQSVTDEETTDASITTNINSNARNQSDETEQQIKKGPDDTNEKSSKSVEMELVRMQEEYQKATKDIEMYKSELASSNQNATVTIQHLQDEISSLKVSHENSIQDLHDTNSIALENQKSKLEETMKIALGEKERVHIDAMVSAAAAEKNIANTRNATIINKTTTRNDDCLQTKIDELTIKNQQLSLELLKYKNNTSNHSKEDSNGKPTTTNNAEQTMLDDKNNGVVVEQESDDEGFEDCVAFQDLE